MSFWHPAHGQALPGQQARPAPSHTFLAGLRDQDELSLGRRALEHLVRAPRLGQRKALRHDRVDVAAAQQFEQGAEVLPEPLRVARLAADGKRSRSPGYRERLVAVAAE